MPDGVSALRVLRRAVQARLRLLIFPYAGGSTASFARWPDYFDGGVELCAVVLQGRERRRRERVPAHVRGLLDPLCGELRSLAPLPVALFGHSMGAIVAHELAHRLAAAGEPPRVLIASGSEAPHMSGAAELAALDDDALVRIADERWDGFPDALRDSGPLRASILALIRADLALLATCTREFASPLPCPLHVFGGDRDPRLTPAHLDAWRRHGAAAFELHWFHGGHLFLESPADAVARTVAELLRPLTSTRVDGENSGDAPRV